MKPIVIIGTGLAGYTLARELRRLDATVPLVMLTADDGAFYSKPMLSTALAQGRSPDDLVMQDAAAMERTLAAQVRTHTEVAALEPAAHRIRLADAEPIEYSKLALALGARPIRPPLKGEAADAALAVNNLTDYRRFRERLKPGQPVTVIGPGLIGCEFANDLAAAGHRVDVVGPDPHPLSALLPPAAGAHLRQALAVEGVRWHLGLTADRIDGSAGACRLTLSDGSHIDTALVLSAVGLRPDTELARASGLTTDRGILADAELRTSAPDVYALGDCAQIEGLVLPFVMPLMHAARALAKTLAGEPTRVLYPAMPVVVKTPAYPVVVSPPPRGAEGDWEIDEQGDAVRALFRAPDGRLLGFALTGAAVAEKQALTRDLPPVLS